MTAAGGQLVVSGKFEMLDTLGTSGVARFDGRQWTRMGDGFGGEAYVFAELGGRLLAGGSIWDATLTRMNLVEWDGQSWTPAGPSPNSDVYALQPMGNALLVGGSFTQVGELPYAHLAKWDGQSWSEFPVTISEPLYFGYSLSVYSLASREDELFVAGGFLRADGRPFAQSFRFGPTLPADIDGDGEVGTQDLATVLASFGRLSTASGADGDLDGDRTVGLSDLALLLSDFSRECR